MRGNYQHYARMTHPNPQRHVVPIIVLTRSRLIPLSSARPVNTVAPQTKVQQERPTPHGVHKPHSPLRRPINRRSSPPASNFHQKVTIAKAPQVNAVKGVKGNWNLSQLLASQTSDKTGLGYDNQVFNSTVFDCDEMFSYESDVSMPTSLVYDRNKSGEGYHAVPPPYTGTFMPFKPDLVFHDAPTVNETVPTAFNKMNLRPFEHPILAKKLRKDIPKSRGHRHSRNRKACFVCKSLTHLIKNCDYYEKKMVQKPVRNHAMRRNYQHYAIMTHPNPQRHVVHTAVLTRSRLIPLPVARPVNITAPQTKVKHQRTTPNGVHKPHSPLRRPINRRSSPPASNFCQKITTAEAPQLALKDKGVIDSGCSRHMTGNITYLSNFEEINGGYVSFGRNPKGGKITRKCKIRTGKLDFDDVYFVRELKFNLFSVSQMCDKKNSVLFTDTECIVLSFDFELPDENHVLLMVPRENNMYNVDLKNIVSSGDLTCLFAKATLDESNFWHRRLCHINFKTMNKLVKEFALLEEDKIYFQLKTIQQYLQNEHYALWEVIEFGDSYRAPPEEAGKGPASESSAKNKGRTVVITIEDM
nr:ribonuclease H-like domain-containing protein [Tanacetum cinerariifolium]